MEQLNFRDDLFDTSEGEWVHSFSDQHFRQRYLRQDGPIYCETLMVAHGTTDVEAALDLISGPWNWWDHGRIRNFTTNPDHSTDQILSPVWWFITRVGLHLLPPAMSPDLKPRIPMLLSRHFTGPASMDVYPHESGSAIVIRGRFHGVDYHVPAVPNFVAEWLHLDAEAGTMPTPFPKGTGWVGLLRKLEKRSTPRRAK